MSHHLHTDPPADPVEFWESRYAETRASGQIWSGRPNQALVDEVSDLAPGRALDLGCGEGGDSLWLAQRGWSVTGLDLSPTAVARAEAAAAAAGVADRVRGVVADLAGDAAWLEDEGAQQFELVSACFLQSPLDFPRTEVLRRAAGLVAPGGRVLVVAHAAPPPWADVPPERHAEFQRVAREVADLDLDEHWEIETAEDREREATGPDGQQGALLDSVLRARRR